MSKSRDLFAPCIRQSAKRPSQKRRFVVESLEGRTRFSGLTANSAYGNDISGSGVTVSQVATDPSGNTYVAGSYTGSIAVRTNSSTVTFPDITSHPET